MVNGRRWLRGLLAKAALRGLQLLAPPRAVTIRSVMELGGLPGDATATLPASAGSGVLERLSGLHTLRRFVVIGATGYLIYQAVLFLMYDLSLLPFLPAKETSASLVLFTHSDLRLLITTLVAAEASIVGAFIGNNQWTFRDRDLAYSPVWLRFLKYNLKATVSTMVIVTGVVNVLTLGLGLYHVIAVPVGVLAGFTWNWIWDAQYIWQGAKKSNETG